ncbi:GH1 family beta-glucosidase [Puniceicoccus vermicola]|uniref:Beta-glucosidase n=1 Tax=Puniceicoccus vermicola TaxID=388746 RepID=A0A7X1AXK4_9BACT|nr:GH1 family beta-glucosidase [Puniceicoccus vermicola]MBC2601754.1 beta-glucosidase [Puniceicoccus vermicola]
MKTPFYWGTATAAYQIEGAWLEDGKGLNIWDAYSHTPGKIKNADTGDVACDHYHLFEKDIELMAELGVTGYRFSLSWSRIIPDGKGSVNPAGIEFYNRLIDGLLAKGITPFITLYHWDLPLTLQLENDGWLSEKTSEAFCRYAKTCFDAFGDRVNHWITFNENWCTAVLGYGNGEFAPGRVSNTEPYLAAHNLLIAHGMAVKEFREGGYPGQIGLANNCDWREPLTDNEADRAAAQESLEFFFAWLTDPVILGDYPAIMKERLGDRLPSFTPEQQALVKGSVDFIGLNHYTTHYASARPPEKGGIAPGEGNGGMSDDQQVSLSADEAWQKTSMGWYVVPWGFRNLLNWIHKRYGDYPIYVTENGCSVAANSREEAVDDQFRANFLQGYTDAMKAARDEDGVPVQGYFCWSLMDNFEWTRGYDMRFGITYVDFETLERTPKASFRAYQKIIGDDLGR